MTNADAFKWYFENVMNERRKAVEEYLSNLEVEFIPLVENPDPTQLEKLKRPVPDLTTAIMEQAEKEMKE